MGKSQARISLPKYISLPEGILADFSTISQEIVLNRIKET